jgi:hypothetical protein
VGRAPRHVAAESLDVADQRGNVDGSYEECAPGLGDALLQGGERFAWGRDEDDGDLFGLRQFAQPRDGLEGPVAVGVDEDETRALHGDTGHEHREGNVDDDVSARAKRS